MGLKEVTDEDRKRLLQEAVDNLMLKGNAEIVHKADYAAVVLRGKKVNHILHLLLALFTFGFWLPFWLFISLAGNTRRKTIQVDKSGKVSIN